MLRPYFNYSIDQLRQLFVTGSKNFDLLSALEVELKHRSAPRAKALARDVLRAKTVGKREAVSALDGVALQAIFKGEGLSTTEKTMNDDKGAEYELVGANNSIPHFIGLAGRAAEMNDNASSLHQKMTEQEVTRLASLYEKMRQRLLDMSLRNPMLNFRVSAASKRQLQFVDEVPEQVYIKLLDEGIAFEIVALPEPEDIPPDERTVEFRAALDHAKVSDQVYIEKVQLLSAEGKDSDEAALVQLEMELRDRVRAKLNMSRRPTRKTVLPSDHARSLGIDPSPDLPLVSEQERHHDKKLQSLKWPDVLNATLSKIGDDARLAEQEMGLSTLFLVFGFLEWYETDDSTRRLVAPLLLLPVKLDKRLNNRGKIIYSLIAAAEIPDTNLSLEKRIERDFGRRLPQFIADEDDLGSVNNYLAAVSTTIEGLRRWRVRPWLMLGHFGFGRLAMYTDLNPERWPTLPISNGLIGAVLRGTDQGDDGGGFTLEPPDDYATEDPEIEKIAPYLVHDADASQHSALVDALSGKNLVIHGPPGTGKSQTITNLIANALAQGRKVLFLAEKQAALEVVKRRLDVAGLGKFCLELHSDRAAARRVIDSLKDRHELGYSIFSPHGTNSEGPLKHLRSELNAYLIALHNKKNNSRSLFDDIWASIRAETDLGKAFQSMRNVPIPKHLLLDDSVLNQARDALSLYGAVKRTYETEFGPMSHAPLSSLKLGQAAHRGAFFELKSDFEELLVEAERFTSLADTIAKYGVEDRKEAEAIMAVCELLPEEMPDPGILKRAIGFGTNQLQAVSASVSEFQEAERKLSSEANLKGLAESLLMSVLALHQEVAGTRFEGLPFHQLAAEATQAASWVTACERVVVDTKPLIRAVGYNDAKVETLIAILYSAKFLANVPSEEMAWFAWGNKQNESVILGAHEQWLQLIEKQRYWAKRFPHCRRFPEINGLRSASLLLRKGALARAFGTLAGNARQINTVRLSLGLPEGSKLSPDELEKLALFLAELRDFEGNEVYGRILGNLWSGLKTPLDFIRRAIGHRLLLREKLEGIDAGDEVFEKIDRCSEQNLRHLADLSATMPTISVDDQRRFGLEIVGVALERAKEEAGVAHGILNKKLPDLNNERGSLKSLAKQVELELIRRKRAESLHSSPIYQADPGLFSEGNTQALKLAVDWIRATEQHVRKPLLFQTILSIHNETELQKLFDLAANYLQALEDVDTRLQKIQKDHEVGGLLAYELKSLRGLLKRVLENPNELRAYLDVNSHHNAVAAFGLDDLLKRNDDLKDNALPLVPLLDAMVALRRADQNRKDSAVLSRASGAALEARRSDFIGRDRQKIHVDRKAVANRLVVLRPPNGSSAGPKKQWTEMALLRNEFAKERRFVPVRDLIARAGGAIQTLKPCFMMSPLSLAKYLPAAKLDFDLLIVDEASQMRPEDALGALLRVKQLVVVGDAKQLPPTDFFRRVDDDIDGNDDDENLDDESILEVCQKTFGQTRMLRWHYRSRCESLIAFSNREFYKNALVTFPSPEPQAFSVDLIRVNGKYKAGCNPQEAQRIAEEAIAFMRHFADADDSDTPTIGLVAINTSQRDRIFEELRQLESGDEKVERYRERVAAKGEPVFVKNLENVQGDERDFILISLTYGPEEGQTVVAQRFGPIATKQGHRRLNVLFSRARSRIGLFTSMGSEDVRPSDTSSEGTRVLKRYLEYAEHQGKREYQSAGGVADSDFELEVAARLRARGYQIETQIGVSGYRIDIGVRDPRNSTLFLAGIECDGASYHSSKSARERDRLREEILKGLGWKILRVWSTDWFDNSDGETDKLCQKIEALRVDTPRQRSQDYEFVRTELAEQLRSAAFERESASPEASDRSQEISIDSGQPTSQVYEDTVVPAVSGRQDIAALLRQFRDNIIAREIPDWEPQRSILRDGMIETLIAQRITDPGDWYLKVPLFQRVGTNPVEKERYFTRLCEIIEGHCE